MKINKKFNVLLLKLLSLVSPFNSVWAKGESIINNDLKKIVFLGDSITYAGHYVSFVESYLKINNPEITTQFINLGLPSETVSGLSETNHAYGKFPRPDLHERLIRVLEQVKPDLLFANYGINDGIYLAFDQQRFKLFQQGIRRLHKEASARAIQIVHIAPPIFDAKYDAAYAQLVHTYADWILSQQQTDNWQVIDGHWPMQNYLDQQRATNPKFYLAKDGVHPNKIGHGIIAQQILEFLGYQVDPVNQPGEEMIHALTNGKQILNLVTKRQGFLRDAWLAETGHERPNIAQGMPLEKAARKSAIIELKIMKLLH